MRKSLILFICLFISTFNLFSQDFYDERRKCENRILEKEYILATEEYKSLFEKHGTPYPRDIHNFLICSIHGNDSSSINLAIDLFSNFSLDSSFLQYIKSDYNIDLVSSPANTDQQTNNFINKLKIIDQSIRNSCKEINKYYYSICEEEIRNLDSINLKNLFNFFTPSGVPDLNTLENLYPGHLPPYLWSIIHGKQWGYNDFDSLLLDGVKGLKFDPEMYCYYKDKQSKVSNFGTNYYAKLGDDELYVFPISDTLIMKSIDKSRKTCSSDKFDLMQKKLIFQYQNPEFILIPQTIVNFKIGANESLKNTLKEKWKDLLITK